MFSGFFYIFVKRATVGYDKLLTEIYPLLKSHFPHKKTYQYEKTSPIGNSCVLALIM